MIRSLHSFSTWPSFKILYASLSMEVPRYQPSLCGSCGTCLIALIVSGGSGFYWNACGLDRSATIFSDRVFSCNLKRYNNNLERFLFHISNQLSDGGSTCLFSKINVSLANCQLGPSSEPFSAFAQPNSIILGCAASTEIRW